MRLSFLSFRRLTFFWCLFSLGICLFLPFRLSAVESTPRFARSGSLNLSEWRFQDHGPVTLSGQWRFYWNRFVSPDQVSFSQKTGQGDLANVPGSWHRYADKIKPQGSYGYATFALRVILPEPTDALALYIRNVLTAYDLYINGEKVQQTGRTAKTREEMLPEYRHVVVPVPDHAGGLEIVFHVSNFHHRLGGIWAGPVLGLESQLRNRMTHRLAMNLFMIGSIFIMGLYHISLYILRKSYSPPLYLGLFCSLITLRAVVTNELYLHTLMPGIPWELMVKLEYLSFYLAVPVFVMFIASLFPKELGPGMVRVFLVIGGVFSFLVLIFPVRIFSHTIMAYEIVTLACILFMGVVLGRAAVRQREGIWPIIFGFVFLLVTVINDILHANSLIRSAYIFQSGMFVFVFSQAFVLSHRFSKTFETVENQTLDLIGMNTVLTREIHTREKLEASLVESHDNFKNSRIALILGLAKLAEYRDTDTGTHLERIREYVRLIAEEMASLSLYRGYITPEYIEDIYQSSILHDIGKIGIRDAILLKPGKLTDEEFEIMKTHTLIGGDAITEVASQIKTRSFLTLAKDIAYYHHERWDGQGYPYGISGRKIPLSARIAALADVYDALTSERPYKKAFPHERALEIILKDRNCQFDPDVVDAFCRQSEKIWAIRKEFQDAPV